MRKTVPLIRTIVLVLFLLFPVRELLAQQVVIFAADAFENHSLKTKLTAGQVISGSFDNAGIQLSSGIMAIDQWFSTSINEADELLPLVFRLDQNYPNPFNPITTIGYQLPADSDVRLDVFNALGQRVAGVVNSRQEAGTHTIHFNAAHLSSGVYLYRLTADGVTINTRTMTLVK